MKLEDMKHGMVVVLTRDVTNPEPDRRVADRNWAAQPVWPKGKRLLVRWQGRQFAELSSRYYRAQGCDAGFSDLVAACEPAPRTLSNLLWSACDGGSLISQADAALEVLVQQEKLTLDDVEAALKVLEDRS